MSTSCPIGRHPKSCWLIALLLLGMYVAQCAWFVRTQSLTYDEPVHLLAGLDAWRNNRFALWNDHPPLARLLFTLPLIDSKWQVKIDQSENGKVQVSSIQPDPSALTWRSRVINVFLGVLLGVLLWIAARKIWSDGAANFALALFAFSPSLIAHFSLVTTDGIGALMIFATALQLLRWRRNPNQKQTILFGLVLGLLLLAKFYTPPFFLLTLGLVLVLKPQGWTARPANWNWKPALSAAIISIFVLWAGYFFHVSHLMVWDNTLSATFPNRDPLVKTTSSPLQVSVLIPAGEYIDGIRSVKFHNRLGHASFFLGEVSKKGGWKSYYPVIIALKWPSVVLILLIIFIWLVARGKLRMPSEFALLWPYPALVLALGLFARIQIGERHILAAYPFVLLLLAGLWDQIKPNRRGFQILLIAAVCLHAADALRFAPNYLSYMTPFKFSPETKLLVTDSNLDWGQGLISLREYQLQHPGERLHLAYFGSVDPALYGVQAEPLPEKQRVTGKVVVSATSLSGQYLKDPNGYRWVLEYPLTTVLNDSLFVFDVPSTGEGVAASQSARPDSVTAPKVKR